MFGDNDAKKRRDLEHRLQVSCVRWFHLAHRDLTGLLFAVPNGGRRDRITGARLKLEGVMAGVSDLILLKPNKTYHGLLIEMKTAVGVQSQSQKDWQSIVTKAGYKYIVCRTLDKFREEVDNYLNDKEI